MTLQTILSEVQKMKLQSIEDNNGRSIQFFDKEFETKNGTIITAELECRFENQPITIGEENFELVSVENVIISAISNDVDINLDRYEEGQIEALIISRYNNEFNLN